MRRWLLVHYDDTEMCEIQARDEHPERDTLDDEQAFIECMAEAAQGDAEAQAALDRHRRDRDRLAEYKGAIAARNAEQAAP